MVYDAGSRTAPSSSPTEAEAWQAARASIAEQLKRTAGTKTAPGAPKASLGNLNLILCGDPEIAPTIGYDEFRGVYTWKGKPTSDEEETKVNTAIEGLYGLTCPTSLMREAYCFVAKQRSYHVVRDYLKRLVWDGAPRIDTMLTAYTGAEDTALTRAMSRRFLLSCVARVVDPGCQVDTTLILVGRQGVRKSSFFRALVPEPSWFSDTAIDMAGKDAYAQMQGVWLYELAELASLRARDAEAVKAFLSARVDRYRPAYARNVIQLPRQTVFVGSTNEAEFLDDPTGARRFWPVAVEEIDTEAVARDRDQLWAEAYEVFDVQPRPQWWLTAEEGEALLQSQSTYTRSDPWADVIGAWLSPTSVSDIQVSPTQLYEGLTVAYLLSSVLNVDLTQQHKAAAMRVGGILTRLGFTKRQRMVNGVRMWRWFPSVLE
jgi:putative DNA primase/helicase